jgi:hypothetical protein
MKNEKILYLFRAADARLNDRIMQRSGLQSPEFFQR